MNQGARLRAALALALTGTLVGGFLGTAAAEASGPAGRCFIVTGGRVADGSGGPLRQADVRVCGGTIREVGKAHRPHKHKGERVIDAAGLIVAPGFIDIHNHSTDGLVEEPLAASQVSQGITTLVVGADGESPFPIADYLRDRRAHPAAVNVMALVGHATVRQKVMGEDYKRPANPPEIARMAKIVESEMRHGAVGLSSGLEYEVGSWSTTEELVALGRAAARHGGFYMTHTRDEADRSIEAFTEAIAIAERGGLPLQISHIKLGTVGVWGKTSEVFRLVEAAQKRGMDITADCYPYEAWHANIEILVPSKKYDDPETVRRGIADVGGADRITISSCKKHPDWENRNLEEIAKAEATTPEALFSRIVRDGSANIICHSMREEDVLAFYGRPWVMVASDGGIGSRHPRGAGTFPRVLGRFVREKNALALPEAIRKMTSMPAYRLKLADRGRIRAGARADLVLFDPDMVVDRSTFADPLALSDGIRLVLVNGEAVWEDGKVTGSRPGKVLGRMRD